jgi:two-component system OmpR family response regulator
VNAPEPVPEPWPVLPALAGSPWTPLILVVDGDAAVVDLTSRVLRQNGFDVIAARDGVEAVARWEADAPDLVLLELNLEGRNGFEVCADIRHASRTPVIVLTTSRDEQDALRAFNVGADDYITKPFSPVQLVARIVVTLRRQSQT